jgi:hypothetical protein
MLPRYVALLLASSISVFLALPSSAGAVREIEMEPVTYNGSPREGAVFSSAVPLKVTWDGLQTGAWDWQVECRIDITGPDGNPLPGAYVAPPIGYGCGELSVTLPAPLQPGTYHWDWWHIAPGHFENHRSYGWFRVVEPAHGPLPSGTIQGIPGGVIESSLTATPAPAPQPELATGETATSEGQVTTERVDAADDGRSRGTTNARGGVTIEELPHAPVRGSHFRAF